MTCAKSRNALWSLRRRIHSTTPEIKILAYKTLIRPILEYAKIIWDPYTVTNKSKLDKIQRLALRFFYNKYRRHDSPSELNKIANLPSLESRTSLERLKFLFLVIHDLVSINKNEYFSIQPDTYFRHRHSMYIPPPLVFIDSFKFSFFPRAINEWNGLPDTIVKLSSISEFQEKVKSTYFI